MGSKPSTPDTLIKNDPTVQGYFRDLQQIFTHNYIENDKLISNMTICSKEKNFDNEYDGEAFDPNEFINWLDYLYNYLEQERQNNREWADNMLDRLDNEYFLSENKYLSQFFFEEYGIISIPECICKKSKRDRKLNANSSMLNVTQNLGGSFGDSFNQFDSKEDPAYKYKLIRNKIKRYIKTFKEHIMNKDHPINIVVQIFEKFWVIYANEKIETMKKTYPEENEDNEDEIKKIVLDLTKQVQTFVMKAQTCLKLFYSRTINFTAFNEEKDELINLMTTLVFRTGKMYDVLFSLYEFNSRKKILDLKNKFDKLKSITPEDLGIISKFCLNLQTLNLQEEILKKNLEEMNAENEEENKNDEIDMEKGAIEIDLREKKMEKRKINLVLSIIQEKKKRVPKPGQRNIDDMKVNVNFDDENSESEDNLNINQNKNDSMNLDTINNNYIGHILPKLDENDMCTSSANVSMDNITIHKNIHKNGLNLNDDSDDLIVTNNNNIIDTSTKNKKENKKDFLFNKKTEGDNKIIEDADTNIFIVRDSFANQKNLMPNVPEKILGRVSFQRANNDDLLSYPYETAIILLKQIKKYKTPFEKMMIIASLSNEITDCINDFWTEMEQYIKKDFLGIEADILMNIYVYVFIKSGISEIFVHYQMINFFTTVNTKSSTIGYYFSTITASIKYIEDMKNVDDILKGKIKLFADD